MQLSWPRAVCACISPVASNFISSCCTSHSVIFSSLSRRILNRQSGCSAVKSTTASSFALKCASLFCSLAQRATSARLFSPNANVKIKMLTFDSGWRLQTHTHWGDSRYLHLCWGTAMQRETSFHCKIMTLHSLPHTKWSTECDLSHMAFARTAPNNSSFFLKNIAKKTLHYGFGL